MHQSGCYVLPDFISRILNKMNINSMFGMNKYNNQQSQQIQQNKFRLEREQVKSVSLYLLLVKRGNMKLFIMLNV